MASIFDSTFTIPSEDSSKYMADAPKIAVADATSATTTNQTEDLKEIFGLIKSANLLPGEMNQILSNLSVLFANKSLYKNGKLNTNALVQVYVKTLQQINSGKFNKEQYKEAYDQAVKNGGLNEVAITSSGQIVAQDKNGEIKAVSPESINNGQYVALTNSDLLELRAQDSKLAYNNTLLQIVENAIGSEKVMDLIQKAVKNLGSSTIKVGESVKAGLETLQTAQDTATETTGSQKSLQELFNDNLIQKDQTQQVKAALMYLWDTLPQNAKTWLQMKSDGTRSGAFNLIAQLATANSSSIQANSHLLKSGSKSKDKTYPDTVSGSVPLSKSMAGTPVNAALSWLMGNKSSDNTKRILIQDSTEDGIPLTTFYGAVTNSKNEPIGKTTLNEVHTSTFGSALDLDSAHIGDQKIVNLGDVLVDGNELYSMELPIDEKYFADSGQIRPDFQLLRRVSEVEKQIKPGMTTEQKQALYAQANLPVKYYVDPKTGEERINTSKYIRFGVLNATAIPTAVEDPDLAETSRFLKELTKPNTINATLQKLDQINKTSLANHFDYDDWGVFEGPHDSVLEGQVFIPVNNNILNAMTTSGSVSMMPAMGDFNSFIDIQNNIDRDRAARENYVDWHDIIKQ